MALEFKFKKEIAQKALDSGAVIFGGYVRDMIVHNYWATRFYARGGEWKEYNDKTVHPETAKGRFTIPNDIDCVFENRKDHEEFIQSLSAARYDVVRVFYTTNAEAYIPRVPANSLSHARYTVKFLNYARMDQLRWDLIQAERTTESDAISQFIQISRTFAVSLDIFIKKDTFSGRGPVDFECNSLLLNKQGVRCSSYLPTITESVNDASTLSNIIDDIVHFRAKVSYELVDGHRVKKMKNLGWDLVADYFHVLHVQVVDDVCVICHEPVLEPFRLTCCNTVYHATCLCDAVRLGSMTITLSCMVCRASIPHIQRDIRIFEQLK
jgi:hypothetical protein